VPQLCKWSKLRGVQEVALQVIHPVSGRYVVISGRLIQMAYPYTQLAPLDISDQWQESLKTRNSHEGMMKSPKSLRNLNLASYYKNNYENRLATVIHNIDGSKSQHFSKAMHR